MEEHRLETALGVAVGWLSLSLLTAGAYCVMLRRARRDQRASVSFGRRREDHPWALLAPARGEGKKPGYGRRRDDLVA